MAILLVLDVKKDTVRLAQCNELDDYYRELDVEIFDIARRKIGGQYYDIFVGDVGLYRENPVISAVSAKAEPMLVGNLIFANHDGSGETVSLNDSDIKRIIDSLVRIKSVDEDKWHLAVTCEY